MTAFAEMLMTISTLILVPILLCLLPILFMLVRLLWRLYLLPVAAYFVCARLIWPVWAAEHETICIILFTVSVLLFVSGWVLKIVRRRRENNAEAMRLLASIGYDPHKYKLIG